MTKNIKRSVLGITLCFCILSLALVYWQFIDNQELLAKPGNMRSVYEEQKIWRGGIFDRNGEILAKSYTPAEAEKLLGKKVQPTIRPPGNQYPAQIRIYPKGELFTHVVGTYSFIYGRTGIEDSLNKLLLGLGPKEKVEDIQFVDRARRGNDVVLTLDTKIQAATANAFKNKSGAAVAIEPKSGRVLAMVSAPTFDPNELDQKYQEISEIGNQVFINKAVGYTYTPGSVMKLVTSGGLLRAGLDVRAEYEDTGKDRVEAKGESREVVDAVKEGLGTVDFYSALAKSSNTYFATRAAMAGDVQFLEGARRYGFGQAIPLDELRGPNSVVRSSTINRNGIPPRLKLGELMDSSYGQGEVQVTALHMAMVGGAIANKGRMMRPALVERVLNPKQETVYRFEPQVWLTPLTPEEAKTIEQGMVAAVEYGTASSLGLSNAVMAAKTGSAELGQPGKAAHGWFVAYAPVDDPQIAVAVVVEHGASGASSAGPIAREIIQAALRERR